MNVVELPQSWRGRALIVRDIADPEEWFTSAELSTIESFRLPKRRREWMLSRIAEKELRRRGARGGFVSFSHSGPLGAAAVSDAPIGIDIEVRRTVPAAAAHLFVTDDEAAAVDRCAISDALLHFWSAKEARWKQLGGTVATVKRVPLTLIQARSDGLTFNGVETFATTEIVAALTI